MASSAYPKALESLVTVLRRLPGIGRRSAERLALAMLEWPESDLHRLGDDIANLRRRVLFCTVCGNLADSAICRICAAPNRDQATICVVEYATQIPVIEGAGCFRGLYHVLGGRLLPLEGRGPEQLRVRELRERLETGLVHELILATSPDVEGEATAHFLASEFATCCARISRIALGVPVGADLCFADAATIAMAMGGRRPLGN